MKQKIFFVKKLLIGISVGVIMASLTGCNSSTSPSAYTLPKRYFKDSVQVIFNTKGCTDCHSSQGPGWGATGGNKEGGNDTGLDLSSDSSFKLLVNRTSDERRDTILVYCNPPQSHASVPLYRVKPGFPDSSYLYHKISSDTPECGDRMPAGGYPPLSDAEIAIIKKWIQYGAPLGDTTTH